MWIEMLETYVGVAGIFAGRVRYDLPESTLKQIPNKFRKNSSPPWEDASIIPDLRRPEQPAVDARRSYEIVKAWAKQLAGEAEAVRQAAGAAVKPTAEAQAAAKIAEAAALHAKKAAEKKNATNKQKKKAIVLAREYERLDALHEIAVCKMRRLMAEHTLKRLETENAAKEASRLAEKLRTGAEKSGKDATEDDGKPEQPATDSAEQPQVQNEVTQ